MIIETGLINEMNIEFSRMMIDQVILGVFLSIPLIFMIFPSIKYWSEYRSEQKNKNIGKKPLYKQPYFSILILGVLCMWIIWIGGIIFLLLEKYITIFEPLIFHSSYNKIIQIIGLVVFYTGATMYNANIIVAGKYLRPAPSGTLGNQKLVCKGPFALIRHPLYVSYILILIGCSFILLSYWLLIPAILIIISIYPTAKTEEETLIEELGEEYIEYKKKTGMFFPKLIQK